MSFFSPLFGVLITIATKYVVQSKSTEVQIYLHDVKVVFLNIMQVVNSTKISIRIGMKR